MRWASNMSDKQMQISLTMALQASYNTTEWRILNHSQQPHSLCLSVLCSSFLCSSVVAPVGRLYSSVLPRRQTWRLQEVNVLQWGGQVVTKEFQTLSCTSSLAPTSSVSDIHWDIWLTLQQCFEQVNWKINPFSHYTAVGGGESEEFLMFLSKIGPIHMKILANLCNKLKNFAKECVSPLLNNFQNNIQGVVSHLIQCFGQTNCSACLANLTQCVTIIIRYGILPLKYWNETTDIYS